MRVIAVFLKTSGTVVGAFLDPTSSSTSAPLPKEVFPATATYWTDDKTRLDVTLTEVDVSVRVVDDVESAKLDAADFFDSLSVRVVDGKPDARLLDHPAWTPPPKPE